MEMDAFLESQQSKVWKIIVKRGTNGAQTEEIYNGVCIRIDGLILTHAFHIDDFKSISIYCTRYGSSRAVHRCDGRSGLCLLNAIKKNDYDYLEFGKDTILYIGQVLYGICYTKLSTNPIIQMGYVAYDYNPDSEFVTPLTPAVRTAKSIDKFYLGIVAFHRNQYDLAIHVNEIKK